MASITATDSRAYPNRLIKENEKLHRRHRRNLARFGLGVIGTIGVACIVPACDKSPTRPSYQDDWAHEQSVREWEQAHDGYSGAFACHTADGGCLHMTCTTKTSCDYMAEAEKRCATPSNLNKPAVVEDDSCKSTEAATSFAPANSYMVSTGTGWVPAGTGTTTTVGH